MHQSLSERWNRVSLRTKITGVTVLMLTLGLLVAGIGTMTMLRVYVLAQMDARLATTAASQSTIEQLVTVSCEPTLNTTRERMSSEYFVAIFDDTGKLCNYNWKDRPADELPVPTFPLDLATMIKAEGRVFDLTDKLDNTTFHAVAVPVTLSNGPDGTMGVALVAVSLAETEKTLATYLSIFLGFGVGVIILGALITRMLVTSTFAPLREVERTAAAIADGDFSQRLGGATPNTEVGRLNRSLNTMLNRIDRAFKDRARTIDQMRRFVGDASHELRTPLVSVRGYAELYRMGALQTPEEVAQAMERIEKEAIRMGGLVEDLLELARLDETKPLALAPVDLVPLARDAALDAMASSPGRTITVLTPSPAERANTGEVAPVLTHPAAPEGVSNATGPIAFAGATLARLRSRRPRRPGAETPLSAAITAGPIEDERSVMVLAEENKIRQVFTNLLGNAMRFTPVESPIEISVSLDRNTERASFAIIDHGEGIPPQIREKIFQRFWRADTSRARETGGSGLGLAIVSSIVAAHNGTVDVVETPGGGATFRVNLPLADSAAAPKTVTPAETR
ncbi:sensor histidine kinase [Microterricola pindariensis]|uniref:histidine kinase n=1 Tax=Microterricola pindariensis TaxID=478010 RepID=A0ABX5AZ46_9MICO|nr:HAMP domain-containing sensor histidine kinase [Microterricola pindariensis]PPL19718.1 two-component sensor histidine kinase [Microterricola pindariensis]